jgi:lipopolysaccharide assembly protein A
MIYLRYFYTLLSLALFFAVLGFAAKNAEPVTLHYYLGLTWSAPLVLVLLACFGIGAAFGIVASLGLVVRQRRALSALRRELSTLNPENGRTPAPN